MKTLSWAECSPLLETHEFLLITRLDYAQRPEEAFRNAAKILKVDYERFEHLPAVRLAWDFDHVAVYSPK
jgi:hypothetical protein